jgi:hypothetical protein
MPKLDKAILEMTSVDHVNANTKVPYALQANPRVTLAETMSDQDLLQFVTDEVKTVRKIHAEVMKSADTKKKEVFMDRILGGRLLPNIGYLERIKRLPDEFKTTDFSLELSLDA